MKIKLFWLFLRRVINQLFCLLHIHLGANQAIAILWPVWSYVLTLFCIKQGMLSKEPLPQSHIPPRLDAALSSCPELVGGTQLMAGDCKGFKDPSSPNHSLVTWCVCHLKLKMILTEVWNLLSLRGGHTKQSILWVCEMVWRSPFRVCG